MSLFSGFVFTNCQKRPIFTIQSIIIMGITIGLLIPLLGTMLGAAFVFFMKKDMSPKLQKSLLRN